MCFVGLPVQSQAVGGVMQMLPPPDTGQINDVNAQKKNLKLVTVLSELICSRYLRQNFTRLSNGFTAHGRGMN